MSGKGTVQFRIVLTVQIPVWTITNCLGRTGGGVERDLCRKSLPTYVVTKSVAIGDTVKNEKA